METTDTALKEPSTAYSTLQETPKASAHHCSPTHSAKQTPPPPPEALALELDEQDLQIEPPPTARQELHGILQLVYPTVITSVLEFFPGFLCVILVGHLDSPLTKEYVDAATLSAMFTNITALGVGYGLASALDTLCSQANGANKPRKIGIYLQAGFLVIGFCLVPLAVINWYTGTILRWCNQDKEVARLAGEFSQITVFGIPFVLFYEMNRKLLQSQGIVKPLVLMAVASTLANVGFGYWLTYHTSLGFHGAALSRTLGYIVLVAALMSYYLVTKHYKVWWPGWNLRQATHYVRLFLQLGIPGMFMMVLEWWAYEITALMAGMLPDAVLSVSAHAVFYSTVNMLFMVFYGIAVAGNVSVGNALGANQPERARLICQIVLWLTFISSCISAVMILVLRHQIPQIFVSDQESIDRASKCLLVAVGFVLLNSVDVVLQGVYRGAGKQTIAATMNAVAYYIVGIPLAAVLAFVAHWSVEGLWAGIGVGILTSFASCGLILRFKLTWADLAREAQERTNA